MSDGEEHEAENFEAEDQIVGVPLTKGLFSVEFLKALFRKFRFTGQGSQSIREGRKRKWFCICQV